VPGIICFGDWQTCVLDFFLFLFIVL